MKRPSNRLGKLRRIPALYSGIDFQDGRAVLDVERVFVRIDGREISLADVLASWKRSRTTRRRGGATRK